MTFTYSCEEDLLNDSLGNVDGIFGNEIQVALSTTAITKSGTGMTEPSGNNYSRVTITNNTYYWANASGSPRTKTNAQPILFPVASGTWGTITYWALLVSGTPKIYGLVTDVSGNPDPQTIGSGDTVRFPAGQLIITLS